MSFRYRIARITKVKHQELKDKTDAEIGQICELDEDCGFYPGVVDEIIDLLYIDMGNNFTYQCDEFFHDENITGESTLVIIGKPFIEQLIEYYRQCTIKYYEELISRDPGYTRAMLVRKATEWGSTKFSDLPDEYLNNMHPYCLRDNDHIVESDRMEYDVFELVNILKNFNFEDDELLLSGW